LSDPGKLIQSAPPKRKQPSSQGLYDIIDLDLSRYDRIASRVRQVAQDDVAYLKSGIQTQNAAFNILIGEIEHVAMRSVEPILLIGPTGAGKSQLARRIHELKRSRSQLAGRFVEVNCATLRGDAALSTLFGHRKGAFTGAASDRGGLLREADGGMLFLDEIGELGLDEQAMLLRAIEEKRFYPMGADTEVASDFQLVCGTNRDLRSAISTGTFREDLLERINLWTFTYPGLRERREDIEPNLDYELDRFADANNRRVRFSREARERYLSFAISPRAHWHANFRDLNSSIIRMATLAPGGRITRDVVSRELARLNEKWGVKARSLDSPVVQILGQQAAEQLDRFDYAQLAEVLKVCLESHSVSEAGRSLFAISRTQRKKTNDADRLRKYLARFGLSWQTLKGRE
jgi:transcriptional regulatory protein RtcR